MTWKHQKRIYIEGNPRTIHSHISSFFQKFLASLFATLANDWQEWSPSQNSSRNLSGEVWGTLDFPLHTFFLEWTMDFPLYTFLSRYGPWIFLFILSFSIWTLDFLFTLFSRYGPWFSSLYFLSQYWPWIFLFTLFFSIWTLDFLLYTFFLDVVHRYSSLHILSQYGPWIFLYIFKVLPFWMPAMKLRLRHAYFLSVLPRNRQIPQENKKKHLNTTWRFC